jgi:hypothetical protein
MGGRVGGRRVGRGVGRRRVVRARIMRGLYRHFLLSYSLKVSSLRGLLI